jgi:hypothetical protein
MDICIYQQHEKERRESLHKSYVESSDFTRLESIAKKLGYRKANIREINNSAESIQGSEELFCWKGGLWIKIKT